jgi:peroxiredoxin
MTQLVELQAVMCELRAAGYEPFAISNDPIDRLADFAKRHHIGYALLSDEDSAVIRRFGILNTLIQPGEGRSMRWYGIPYPGTYFTDERGIIVDKDFHQHHARRASGRALLHRVLRTVPGPDEEQTRAIASSPDVTLEAYLTDEVLRLEVISTLVCRLAIRDGLHLYAPGAPEAFTPARIAVTGDGIRAGEARWPAARDLHMPLLDLSVPVWEGAIAVTLPLTATSEVVRLGHGLERSHVDVCVELAFQACDEDSCGLPQRLGARLRVPLATLVEPEGIKAYVNRIEGSASERGK